MSELLGSLAVVLVGIVLVAIATGGATPRERNGLVLSLAVHYAGAVALWWMMLNVYGLSDVNYYIDEGRVMRRLLDDRPVHWTLEVVKLLCRLPNELPIEPGPTSNMTMLTGLFMWATDSVWTMFLFCSLIGFAGKWAIYASFRDELELENATPLLLVTMAMPSCVFWTSGMVKETFALCGLGLLIRGTQKLLRTFSPTALFLIPLGIILVAGFKPFFLFAFVIAVAVWIVFSKSPRLGVLAPIVFGIAGALAIAGIALLSKTFNEFAFDNVAESIAHHQRYGEIGGGGSFYEMGNAEARSVGGQIGYAPLALITSLARPFPFEIHNPTAAAAAAELTLMLVFLLLALRRSGAGAVWRRIVSTPILVFALVFTFVSAIGIGLATTNFGTLSRYRTPFLPFYFALIVSIRYAGERSRAPVAVASTLPPALAAELRARRQRRPAVADKQSA